MPSKFLTALTTSKLVYKTKNMHLPSRRLDWLPLQHQLALSKICNMCATLRYSQFIIVRQIVSRQSLIFSCIGRMERKKRQYYWADFLLRFYKNFSLGVFLGNEKRMFVLLK